MLESNYTRTLRICYEAIMSKGTAMIKVMIADDELIVRRGVKSLLSEVPEIEVVEPPASNKNEAIQLTRQHQPNVILMDIKMPFDKEGLEATREITTNHPNIKCILLTSLEAESILPEALACGAKGYLKKGTSTIGMAHAIEAVYSGRYHFNHDIAQHSFTYKLIINNSPFSELSGREHIIARYLALGWPLKNIMKELNVSERTVSRHRKNIMKKLKLDNRAQLAHLALQYQLINLDIQKHDYI